MGLDDLEFQKFPGNDMWHVAKLARCEVWRSNHEHPDGEGIVMLCFDRAGAKEKWLGGGWYKARTKGLASDPIILSALIHEYSK